MAEETDAERITTLCEQHAGLTRHVANHLAARLPIPADDLMPAAWDGLYQAATTWRPDGGRSFREWAWWRITSVIIDDIRATRPLPRSHWRHDRAVWAARDRLTAQLGHTPTSEQVREAAGLTPAQWALYRSRVQVARDPISIDAQPLDWPDEHTDPADGLDAWVRAAAAALPEQEAQVIAALYWDQASVTDVAADLGVVESRVSQIRWAAIARMRDAIRWHTLRDPGQPITYPPRARRRDQYRAAVAAAHEAAPAST